jgi:hypothetical protein
MNTRTHTLPTGSIESTFKPIPAPDIMEIINRTVPGDAGVSILYSLAGGVEMRIAKLAAMVTNTMAGHLRNGNEEFPAIDKYNDAIAGLDEAKARTWAFEMAGTTQHDMIEDLKDLIAFRLTVTDQLTHITKKPFATRWVDTIERAGTPQAVEEWKLELSWSEYVEGCHGKTEMTEEEFKKVESVNLAGTKQNWSSHVSQIIDTISLLEGDAISFDEINVPMQKRLLESLSSEDKEARFRTSALKLARNPADLHTRRAFISSFCCAAREALKHTRYAERSVEPEVTAEAQAAAADTSNKRRRATLEQQALDNEDVLDLVSDEI